MNFDSEIERRTAIAAEETQAMPLAALPDLEPEPDPEPSEERVPEPVTRGQSPVLRLIEQTRVEREARHERVAGLFPPPETTEWNIREVAYDRSRRAEVSAAEVPQAS